MFNLFKTKSKKSSKKSSKTGDLAILEKIRKETYASLKKEKKNLVSITKGKVSKVKMVNDIILPFDANTNERFDDFINMLDKLLKKTGYVDNIKADTLRKLIVFLDNDIEFEKKENLFLEWLKSADKTRIVKKINVQITR